jgi:general secretion pathway protein A
MYEDFFDLKTLPFKITPDPAFIYWDAAHKRAASILAFGIEQQVPITVVTGEVGTGKTTLLQHFLEEAPRETTVGMISNFWSGMGGLYQWILNAFDIRAEGSPVQLYRAFEDFVISEYAAGRRCVLIVDEAQNVSDKDLEQLRMLTNINARKDCLLMLFLVGQPELRERLQQPNNRQIAQRVGAAFHLGPMTQEATGHYIRHRIAVAGGTREIFDDGAIERVYRVSNGVPRLVNVVCELALVTAFGDGVDHIDGTYMDDFLAEAEETGLIAHLPHSQAPPRSAPAPRTPKSGTTVRKSTSQGNRKPSIRLVSDPWETENADLPEVTPQEPAAPASDPPETDPEADDPVARKAEPEAAILSSEEALELLSPRPLVSDPKPDTDAPEEESIAPESDLERAAAVDPVLAPTDQREPVDRPLLVSTQSLVARILNDGLNIALIGLAIVAVFILISRSVRDTDSARTEISTAETAQTSAESGQTMAETAAPEEPASSPTIEAVDSDPPPRPDGDAAPLAPDAAATPEPTLAPIIPLDDPRGDMLLENALTTGMSDPVGAVIAYSRAALRGEDRAAYYLGQLFETGLGVPRDVAAARAWYELARDNVRSARRRLAELEPTNETGLLSAPVPLFGGPLPDGTAEFVWSAGEGADPEYYIIEMAMTPDEPARRLGPSQVTALSVPEAEADRIWRVLAILPDRSEYTVSTWRGMGRQSGGQAAETTPVHPEVLLQVSADGAPGPVDSAIASLNAVGIAVLRETSGPTGDRNEVRFAYDADRAAAERVASLLGEGVDVVKIAAGSSAEDLVLPGQLAVQLD